MGWGRAKGRGQETDRKALTGSSGERRRERECGLHIYKALLTAQTAPSTTCNMKLQVSHNCVYWSEFVVADSLCYSAIEHIYLIHFPRNLSVERRALFYSC